MQHAISATPAHSFRPKYTPSTTVALIEAEFKHNRTLYEYKLRCAGIAPHELPDALCELFSLAIQWAGSYDASKSSISSWLGNQVVRTVASSIYGTRRPGWRHQQACEQSTDLMEDVAPALAEGVVSGFDNVDARTEDLAVAAFLNQLASELTATEAAVVDICGTDLLHERQTLPQLIQMRELLGVRSLTSVRNFTLKLGRKVRALALEHFGAQDLAGRPGFDRLAA
ncbi:hypothetical protein Q3P06_25170 [Ralstonia pseudosolanacearum]|uniref:hypothetical protein n=1 Tax=Ralstonia pseudosolanacearum TaxID=1310165 RepID=UPI0026760AA5|nr:hypothetical protein [Ralstonia pseudosolanacearum]MDO3515180.1 hypothetical protein [Ralstonia pseudosolanacearum]MDO3634012.1 hypothetical protein [Ralstonia pseudosolanacearum]